MGTLEIDVWSDIACPWCWVGKRGLDSAIESFGSPVLVRWRAFELNPAAERGTGAPVDYVKRLADKYGVDKSAAQEMIDRIVSTGRERGLDLRFDRVLPTNTFDAHRLLSWALPSGKQGQLKEALFEAYLHRGLLVSDHEVLAGLAESAGLDRLEAIEVLQSNTHAQQVREDEQLANRIGIRGVPCFVFPAARMAVSGAQPVTTLLNAMNQAMLKSP